MEALVNNSTTHLYQQRLKHKISNNGIRNDDVKMAWNKLHTNLLNAAEEALG